VNSEVTGKSRAIGIFGGTFDPVHYGHLRTAAEAMEKLQLTEFRLMPAGTPPHRSAPGASAEHRLAMLKLALSGYRDMVLDEREVRRKGYSFMVETLAEIRLEEGDTPVLLMIGQDAANSLDEWHQWRSLFELAHLVIMRRPESKYAYSGVLFEQVQNRVVDDPAKLTGSPAGRVLPLEVTQLAISSSDIRRRIRTGLSPRFLLPDPVIAYIRQQQLYAE
jgi:nicotinate-nucleotide adenylyltransferase